MQKAQEDIEEHLKTAELLSLKGDTRGQKEQIVNELIRVHQRFQARMNEYQILIKMTIQFFKNVSQVYLLRKLNMGLINALYNYEAFKIGCSVNSRQIKGSLLFTRCLHFGGNFSKYFKNQLYFCKHFGFFLHRGYFQMFLCLNLHACMD